MMDMHMPDNCSNDSMPMHMKMATSFFFGLQRPLLFSTWNLNNARELVGAIIVVLIFAILYELLKTVRELIMYYDLQRIQRKLSVHHYRRTESRENLMMGSNNNEAMSTCDFTWSEIRRNVFSQYINPLHVLQSMLHVVQVGMGYLLMLVAMTFNGWLFLAVCFGAGLGYLIFGRCRQSFGRASISSREENEHCH